LINLEEKALNAWPALETTLHKGCLLRSARGYTKRANSANPLYVAPEDFSAVADYAEAYYSRKEQPSVFKIIDDPRYRSFDTYLAEQEYQRIDETLVMTARIKSPGSPVPGVTLEDRFTESWREAFLTTNAVTEKLRPVVLTMLDTVPVETLVASAIQEDRIIAHGYGAVDGEWVGFFDIVVHPDFRQSGWGRKIMAALMGEAARRGVTRGYLQVVADNTPARRLYSSLGFTREYTYWYRKKELGTS